jgi:hypothetical protein
MGLDIYREVSTGVYSRYKEYGATDDSLPYTTSHDGVLGEVTEDRLFVRSDTNLQWYSNVSVQAISLSSPSEVDGTSTGHGIKLSVGSTQPTEAEWEAIDFGNSVTIPNIGAAGAGDNSTYQPFWVRTECPAGAAASNRETNVLRISYTENLV